MTTAALYEIYQQHPQVNTDTRQLRSGDLFFALRGPSFNGNAFAAQALEAGAAYAVIDDPAFAHIPNTLLVPDSLAALQQLAGYHRQQFSIPVIAITGSNGKTTTKELIHAVLSSRFKTYTTEGNLNNHIGIPLTLLRIRKDAELAVIEMGANHIGEIAGYCTYTQPTHGLITNCGKAHLEGFGSLEGVRKAKGELYDHLRANAGTAFIMWDYDYLREMSRGIPTRISYGCHAADYTGRLLSGEPFLSFAVSGKLALEAVQSKLVGSYNLPNLLAAVAVGHHFGLSASNIKLAIESYLPSNSRSQLLHRNGNDIILDAYNANPSSMRLAIENFARLHYPKKVLLLGAMAELGTESIAEHIALIELIKQYPWLEVVLVGGDFLNVQHPFRSFKNSLEARHWFQEQQFSDTAFLIKGSRSSKMEQILAQE